MVIQNSGYLWIIWPDTIKFLLFLKILATILFMLFFYAALMPTCSPRSWIHYTVRLYLLGQACDIYPFSIFSNLVNLKGLLTLVTRTRTVILQSTYAVITTSQMEYVKNSDGSIGNKKIYLITKICASILSNT